MALRVDILTLFPEMFAGFATESMMRIAAEKGLVNVHLHNIREHTHDKHQKVDDAPFGGGPGMVMMVQPVADCLAAVEALDHRRGPIILLTPQGEPLRQPIAERLAQQERLTLVCGHYEGLDERVRRYVTEEISIGDYILTGGELPAMVLTDAVTRLVPGVLGDDQSCQDDSFTSGILEYPQYTRPREFRGDAVPDILLSGHHGEIEKWRREQARLRTRQRRPDII
jgi:tRNA (guanine37-N1)-methyltransferase